MSRARRLARRVGVALVVGVAMTLAAGSVSAAPPDVRAGDVLVRYRTATAPAGRSALETSRGAGGSVVRIAVAPGDEAGAAAALSADPVVAWAEPNRRMRRLGDPAAEPDRARQWHLDLLRADGAWAYTRGDPGIVVAVVDTGIDLAHPDRPARLRLGPSFAGGEMGDRDGHGTHIAGLLAAPANGVGVVGLAPDLSILALKVDDAAGNVYLHDVYRAIVWAVDDGARVINISFGLDVDSPALREAVEYARSRGVLVVASAGNSYADGNPIIYPAAYPGVLAVGAADRAGRRAPYSQAGAYVGLLAPGGVPGETGGDGLLGPLPGGRTGAIAGTSVAAPLAAAAAGLVLAMEPSLTPDQVRQVLIDSAIDVGPTGRDDEHGGGLLDAGAAVRTVAARTAYRGALRAARCPTIAAAGGRTALVLEVSNTGGRVWPAAGADAVVVSAARTGGRSSPLAVADLWRSPDLSVGASTDTPPGAPARFVVPLAAPTAPGIYRQSFGLARADGQPIPGVDVSCDLTVVDSEPYLAADIGLAGGGQAAPGGTVRVIVSVRNVGTETWWRDGVNPLRLGTAAPANRDSVFYDRLTWLSPGRLGPPREAVVPPGATATFEMNLRAPSVPGRYSERVAPLLEGITWLTAPITLEFEVRR